MIGQTGHVALGVAWLLVAVFEALARQSGPLFWTSLAISSVWWATA